MRIDLYEQSSKHHVVYGEFEGVFVDEATGSVAPAIIMDKRGKQGKKVLTLFDCTMLAISGREIVYHPRTFWQFMAPGLRASYQEDWPSRKLWLTNLTAVAALPDAKTQPVSGSGNAAEQKITLRSGGGEARESARRTLPHGAGEISQHGDSCGGSQNNLSGGVESRHALASENTRRPKKGGDGVDTNSRIAHTSGFQRQSTASNVPVKEPRSGSSAPPAQNFQ